MHLEMQSVGLLDRCILFPPQRPKGAFPSPGRRCRRTTRTNISVIASRFFLPGIVPSSVIARRRSRRGDRRECLWCNPFPRARKGAKKLFYRPWRSGKWNIFRRAADSRPYVPAENVRPSM